jgi:hypothetical protein
VVVNVHDAYVKLGPFALDTIREQLAEKYGLKGEAG